MCVATSTTRLLENMGVQRWAFQLTVLSSQCYTLLSEEAAVPLEEEEKILN